ncbi:hypothetical protein FB567DRAFT_213841 [Paraphoma chrysanthemicola]|uniref:N-acetyltransferase domain-containing protein n=1 Tax=Paraphoma chrysanthemicola TaxID=798071 RepID=A0A8K0QW82_9PLEO|nr:hypothetical protein FB567DRAFT_213841 [Paraphoma chrysanthemicola]
MAEAPTLAKTGAKWRSLLPSDIKSLIQIADQIHTDLPESHDVFSERLNLFPDGCLALENITTRKLCGYAISHPIKHQQPPDLDTFLNQIPADTDQYYIHDVAILPEFQGRGYAQECIEKLLATAKSYASIGLVSVYGTASFWSRHGFHPVQVDEAMTRKMKGYGDDAQWLECQNRIHNDELESENRDAVNR